MRSLKDQFGRKVEIGDTIVYAGRSGSSQWLICAKVDDIVWVEKLWWGETVIEHSLKVTVLADKYGRVANRKATLTNPTFAVVSAPQLKLPELKEE